MLLTREPGGSPGAEIIRHVLLSGAAKPFGAGGRGDAVRGRARRPRQCTILPALAAGKWVVCDRFADSTRVYQGVLGQVDRRLIKALERVTVGDLSPDLTLILDVPVGCGMERARRAPRRRRSPTASRRRTSSFTRAARGLLALAADEPERCVVIDASRAERRGRQARSGRRCNARLEPATAPLAQMC